MSRTDINYCFRDNIDFLPLKTAGGTAVIRKKDDSEELRECLKSPDRFLESGLILKDSRTTKAAVVNLNSGKEVFIKRFNNRSVKYTVRYIFRKARPFRVWRAAWALEKAGIPTPRPLAVLANYRLGIPGNAYMIRNSVPAVIPTLDFFSLLKNDADLRESYISEIASLFAKMHNAGIYHSDAKCSNIYVEKKSENCYLYGVWDLVGCKVLNSSLSEPLRIKEMSHIAWSFAEILNREGETVKEPEINNQLMEKYSNAV